MNSSLLKFKAKFVQVLLGLICLSLAYSNCSKVGVKDISDSSSTQLSPTGNPSDLAATCQNAKALGKLRSYKFNHTFEDTKQQCEWGKNGNLSVLDGYVRARKDQLKTFEISTGASTKATICDISMNSDDVSNFYYDDNVLLTLNGYLLASTTDFTRHFTSSNGYYKYDWERLRDKPAQFSQSDSTANKQYCAGKSQGLSFCQFPQTETTGRAELQFDESVIQTILGMTNPQRIDLAVITTGDNDPSTDCRHVPISLAIEVFYIVE